MIDFAGSRDKLRYDLASQSVNVQRRQQDADGPYDSTCSASALGTTQLGSGQTHSAQVFEDGAFGINLVENNFGAIEIEQDTVIILGRQLGESSNSICRDGGSRGSHWV